MKPRLALISLGILALTLLAAPMLTHDSITAVPSSTHMIAQDEIRPNIWGWGIVGNAANFSPFLVWANVSDADSGIQNVTLRVSGPNATSNTLMEYNATSALYEKNMSPFPNNGTFYVYIEAFDNYNNSRTSSIRTIEASSTSTTTIDASVTLPLVVASSIGLMVVVAGLALIYDRRRLPI